jgi:hypothetical protein
MQSFFCKFNPGASHLRFEIFPVPIGITFLDTFGILHIVIKLIKLTIDKDVY